MKFQNAMFRLTPVALGGPAAVAIAAMHLYDGTPIPTLTRDTVSVLGGTPRAGVLSQLGLFFWASGATAGLLGGAYLRRMHGERQAMMFLFLTGLLSVIVGLDDCFEFHEEVGPSIGLPQDGTLAAYAILALVTFWIYRGFVAQTDLVLLAMGAVGAVGFGTSVFLDVLEPFGYRGVGYLLEDGFNFSGQSPGASTSAMPRCASLSVTHAGRGRPRRSAGDCHRVPRIP